VSLSLGLYDRLHNVIFDKASLIGVFFYMALVKRPKNLTKAFIEFYKPFIFEPKRWAKAVPAIGVMMLGFMAFTEMKSVIPLLNPYSWDFAFVELDRLLLLAGLFWRQFFHLWGPPFMTS